jgi:hypothetical protein
MLSTLPSPLSFSPNPLYYSLPNLPKRNHKRKRGQLTSWRKNLKGLIVFLYFALSHSYMHNVHIRAFKTTTQTIEYFMLQKTYIHHATQTSSVFAPDVLIDCSGNKRRQRHANHEIQGAGSTFSQLQRSLDPPQTTLHSSHRSISTNWAVIPSTPLQPISMWVT